VSFCIIGRTYIKEATIAIIESAIDKNESFLRLLRIETEHLVYYHRFRSPITDCIDIFDLPNYFRRFFS
jgi:hypothetical protein